MLKSGLAAFCTGCPNLDAFVRPECYTNIFFRYYTGDHIILCRHMEACEGLFHRIEQEKREKPPNGDGTNT